MDGIPIRHIKAPQKEPAFSDNFSIRDIRVLLAEQDLVQELHRHDFFFILVLKKASGHHEIDFTRYEVGNHTLFFMRPGQVHQLTLKAGSTGYLIQFKVDFFYSQNHLSQLFLHKLSNKNYSKPDLNRFNKLNSMLAYIFEEYTGKQEGYQAVIKSGMDIFFIELDRQYSSSPAGSVNQYLQERLDKLLALIETSIFSQKQVSQYAAMMNVSTYQLNSITKATLGKTCSELINEQIILEAKRHLLATSNQVNQIADQLGYEDVSYFIRFFKKHTGYSPEAFRYNFR